jgi:hypothetical protein
VLRKVETPDALIDVNTTVMKGLRAPNRAAPPQPQPVSTATPASAP